MNGFQPVVIGGVGDHRGFAVLHDAYLILGVTIRARTLTGADPLDYLTELKRNALSIKQRPHQLLPRYYKQVPRG